VSTTAHSSPLGPDADAARSALTPQASALADAIAERVVELLHKTQAPGGLVDAATAAAALGVSRDCVYSHAAELGGKRIGNGPRGRLRFDLDNARAAWISRSRSGRSPDEETPAQGHVSRQDRTPRLGSGPGLLPIRGTATPLDGSERRR
jgi:hypothetical protein